MGCRPLNPPRECDIVGSDFGGIAGSVTVGPGSTDDPFAAVLDAECLVPSDGRGGGRGQ